VYDHNIVAIALVLKHDGNFAIISIKKMSYYSGKKYYNLDERTICIQTISRIIEMAIS